jgi:predicted DNA-binding transcriptional regulator AlpA
MLLAATMVVPMTTPTDEQRSRIPRIHSLKEFAELMGISIATLRRMIRTGVGPTITRMSARRVGIRDDHGRQWQDARAQS